MNKCLTSESSYPGGGGGWSASTLQHDLYPQNGRALLESGVGGYTCKEAQVDINWQTEGGFGGGGGGCTAGGGGGGYTGTCLYIYRWRWIFHSAWIGGYQYFCRVTE